MTRPLSSTLLSRIASEMKDGLCVLDAKQTITHTNTAADELWGGESLSGKQVNDFIAEAGSQALLRAINTQSAGHQGKAVFKRRNGSTIPVHYSVFSESDSVSILFREATEQEELQGKTISFKQIFESNMFGMIYAEIDDGYLGTNQAFLDMVGYTREALVGWREMSPPESMPHDEKAIRQLKEVGAFEPYEKQLIRKDGSRADVLVGGVMEEGTTDRVIAFVVDLSAKKRVERAILKGEELFRNMAEASNVIIWFFTPDMKVHYINQAGKDYMGKPDLDDWDNWEWCLHPDDLPPTMDALKNAFENRTQYEMTHRALRPNTGEYRWMLAAGGPVYSEDHEFLGYVGTSIDIHDLKEAQAELAQYAQKLEQSNKELEHFATIASHDLQEPVRKIMLFTDHLQKIDGPALSEEGADDLKRLKSASTRMQRLINDLLDLSRITRRGSPFEPMDLQHLTQDVITDLSYFHPSAENRVTLMGDMTIQADYHQMRQMLSQLLDNALKFHKPDQPSSVKINIQSAGKNECQITVSDDGMGMKEDQLPRVFDAFVRLHHGAEYPGTGIGLALVKKIVDRHHGSITADSTLGEGSCFTVVLPVIQNQTQLA